MEKVAEDSRRRLRTSGKPAKDPTLTLRSIPWGAAMCSKLTDRCLSFSSDDDERRGRFGRSPVDPNSAAWVRFFSDDFAGAVEFDEQDRGGVFGVASSIDRCLHGADSGLIEDLQCGRHKPGRDDVANAAASCRHRVK